METQEIGKRLGVTSGTLRLWERRGLIGPIKKDMRGWRVWSERDADECRKLMAKMHGNNSKMSGAR